MTQTNRVKFEISLKNSLREKYKNRLDVKIKNKLGISIKSADGFAEINFVYVKWANGYYLTASADHKGFSEFFAESAVPYKSKFLARHNFFVTTLSEKTKKFANSSNGHAVIPAREEWIAEACTELVEKISQHYMPYVENFLHMRLDVVDDVLSNPDYYQFPFLTALYAAKRNNADIGVFGISRFSEKKLMGNPEFDRALARRLLGLG